MYVKLIPQKMWDSRKLVNLFHFYNASCHLFIDIAPLWGEEALQNLIETLKTS